MCNFRNWPITAAQVAPGCLAAFWDDLIMISGGGLSGKVYAYYDQIEHRYIIEWNQVQNRDAGNAIETFEIILYDPLYYPTPTGDGVIDFLYQTVNNGGGEHNSTVGIATPWNGDGVEYTYAGQYPPGAVELHNNMAIRFTTQALEGWEPPEINISPSSISLNIPFGGAGLGNFNIANSGQSTLVYSLGWSMADLLSGGTNSNINGQIIIDGQGGPDAYGYVWIDSDETGGPAYNWIDISSIGTPVFFVHNDSTSEELPISFGFPFYAEFYDSLILSGNGFISFTSHANPAWSNTSLPNLEAPPNMIAGFWDDLDLLQAGSEALLWDNGLDSLVISFLNVPHWGSTYAGEYTFQMILTADGNITCQYDYLSGNYETVTVGIQNGIGSVGLQVAYNMEYLHEGLAVDFIHPFVGFGSPSGAVSPEENVDIEFIVSGSGLQTGQYQADLEIVCNDPLSPLLVIPLTVTVGEIYIEAPEISVQVNGNNIELIWNSISNAAEYKIYYQSTPYFSPSGLPQVVVTAPDTTWTDTGAVNEGLRFYRVVAGN